jgi:hypothetical protein
MEEFALARNWWLLALRGVLTRRSPVERIFKRRLV